MVEEHGHGFAKGQYSPGKLGRVQNFAVRVTLQHATGARHVMTRVQRIGIQLVGHIGQVGLDGKLLD
jgi:hypothetical protein